MPSDDRAMIEELKRLEAGATPAPWTATQYNGATGHGTFKPGTVITSPAKLNKAYPSKDGIVATVYGSESWEARLAIPQSELDLLMALRNHAKRLIALAELLDQATRFVPRPEEMSGHDDPDAPDNVRKLIEAAKHFWDAQAPHLPDAHRPR